MLVLSRKIDEGIVLSMTREQVEHLLAAAPPDKDAVVFSGNVRVVAIRGNSRARVGLTLPPGCHILREEAAVFPQPLPESVLPPSEHGQPTG